MVGAAADFKYLIRVPKQYSSEIKNDENNVDLTSRDGSSNRRWSDKYPQELENESEEDSEDESDDEDIVILRCQTSVCQDGDKCVPIEFDFVVHVRYGNEEDTPQAADTNFPYTIPYPSNINNHSSSKTSSEVDYSVSNASTNRVGSSMESVNNSSTSKAALTNN